MKNDKNDYTLAYITTCKGRLEHLSVTLPIVIAQAGTDVEVIIVDYGCPDGAGNWVSSQYPNVKVIHVNDDPGFNVSRARNLGAANTQAKWLGFFDADILLEPDFFSSVIPTLKQGGIYVSNQNDPNKCGSCIVLRDNFEAIGGYDEAIEGYGGEDVDLYEMLALQGISRDWYPGNMISAIPHSHKTRTQFYESKNILDSMNINHLYRAIKSDIIKLTKQLPNLAERKKVRAQIISKLVESSEKKQGEQSVLRILLIERQLKAYLNLQKADEKLSQPKVKVYLSYEIDNN